MANYLLLRDNKESGPYSLNELLNIGLKAYDLVWIQGKSAAWRYPSEVEELKAFAPMAEEQPFDRFFKKKTVEQVPVASLEKNENIAFKKAVFVTMPASKKEAIESETSASSQSGNSYQRVKTITVTENPVAAEMKYSQPLDEIKEMYVKTLHQRKQKIARRKLIFKNLKRASVFIYVLALGVLIGFTIKSRSGKRNIADQSNVSTQSSGTVQTQSTITSPSLPSEQQQTIVNTNEEEPKKENEKISKPLSYKPVIQKENPEALKNSQSTTNTKKEVDADQNSPDVNVNTLTGERTKKNRNGDEAINNTPKEDISKMVSVKSNDYKRGAFGGIRDLQLTVNNDSKYTLDNVVVALQYLKPSEQPLKTENILFQSIAPKGSLTIAIPPSNRGIKVAFKIVKIESKELNNETAGL